MNEWSIDWLIERNGDFGHALSKPQPTKLLRQGNTAHTIPTVG